MHIKVGAIISYVLIAVNSIYGLVVTPYIVSKIGATEYGIYKMVASLSSTIMVLDFGIGGTILRFVAKYNANRNKDELNTYLSVALKQTIIICEVIILAGTCIGFFIPSVYQTLTYDQISLAQKVYFCLLFNVILTIFSNAQTGIISGYGRFVVSNSLKLFKVIARIVLNVSALYLFPSCMTLVLVDVIITTSILIAENLYITHALNLHIKYIKHTNRTLFFESFGYTALMFIQTIVAQINTSIDTIVIGAISGAVYVTIYSYGLQLFSMFEQLGTSISSLMLPSVSEMVEKNASPRQFEDKVISVGRYQFAILGAAWVGFLIIGKSFIYLWLGKEYRDVWIITMILSSPAIIELIQNVCLSILRARNLMKFKTVITFLMAIINLGLTIFLVKKIGYVGASYGTALGTIIANIIIMDIYYYKKLGINPLRMKLKILAPVSIMVIIPATVLWILSSVLETNWINFLIEVFAFGAVYLPIIFAVLKKRKRITLKS